MSSDSKSADQSKLEAKAPEVLIGDTAPDAPVAEAVDAEAVVGDEDVVPSGEIAAADEPAAAEVATDAAADDAKEDDAKEDDAKEDDSANEIAAADAEEDEDEDGPRLSIVPIEPLDAEHIRCVVEATLLAADDSVTLDRLFKLFIPGELDDEEGKAQVLEALSDLEAACEGRGFELKLVASGYRLQVRQNFSPWVSRLWEEKPPRYTRALLETMALIAYRQPATRGDIEEVRGVTVSSNIMRTLLERGWIREVGHRDVPGRPSMYGTTKEFLDYFNLSSLDQLPSLPEVRELVEPAAQEADDVLNDREESRSEATKALLAERQEDAEDEDGPLVDATETDAAADVAYEVDDESAASESAGLETMIADSSDASDSSDELKSVSTADDDSAEQSASATPVFADNEILVVSELAAVEVHDEATLATLPSADAKE